MTGEQKNQIITRRNEPKFKRTLRKSSFCVSFQRRGPIESSRSAEARKHNAARNAREWLVERFHDALDFVDGDEHVLCDILPLVALSAFHQLFHGHLHVHARRRRRLHLFELCVRNVSEFSVLVTTSRRVNDRHLGRRRRIFLAVTAVVVFTVAFAEQTDVGQIVGQREIGLYAHRQTALETTSEGTTQTPTRLVTSHEPTHRRLLIR